MMLKNRLGTVDEIELTHEEERLSKLAALGLYRDGTLDALAPGTFPRSGTSMQLSSAISMASRAGSAR